MQANITSILNRILFLFITFSANAQTNESAKTQKLTDVNVIVTDFKKVPRPGEQIIFISNKNGKKFSDRADNSTYEGRQKNRRTEVRIL